MTEDLENHLRSGLHDLVNSSVPAQNLAAVVRRQAGQRVRRAQILAAATAAVFIGTGSWLAWSSHEPARDPHSAVRGDSPTASVVPTLDATRIAYRDGSPTVRDHERAARALVVLGSGLVIDTVSHLSPKDVNKPYQATRARYTEGPGWVQVTWYEPSDAQTAGSPMIEVSVVTLEAVDGTRTTMAAQGMLRLVITESPEGSSGMFPLGTRNEVVARALLSSFR